MGRMTAGQMLGRVDALLPNQYGREEKMQWLVSPLGSLRVTERLSPRFSAARPPPEAMERAI